MTKRTLNFILFVFIGFNLSSALKHCNKSEPTAPPDYTEINNRIDTIRIMVHDTIEVIRREPFERVVTRFETIYGEPDTIYQPTYLADSSQLVKCNENAILLEGCTMELFWTQEKFNQCSTAYEIKALELTKERKHKKRNAWINRIGGLIVGFFAGSL